MDCFAFELMKKINQSFFNVYNDNHSNERFGPYAGSPLEAEADAQAAAGLVSRSTIEELQNKLQFSYTGLFPALDYVYRRMSDDSSRQLMVNIAAYRLLGERRVKIYDHDQIFPSVLMDRINACVIDGEQLETGFPLVPSLQLFDLKRMGGNAKIFSVGSAVAITYFIQQYASQDGEWDVSVREGDYVIDAGACWGDTSIYFAEQAGVGGRVFSFEFLPANINIFKRNMQLNPEFAGRVTLIPSPVWGTDGQELHYKDNGPGSRMNTAEGNTAITVSIDSMVREQNIPRIDFIKMDVEGAELEALKGAENTIRTHRPRMALCVYHNNYLDLVNIPIWLDKLELGYKFRLKHASIFDEETVLFATV